MNEQGKRRLGALEITVAIDERPGDLFRARLELVSDGRRGSQEIHGESCAAVSRASVLLLAIALDPEAELPPETRKLASDSPARTERRPERREVGPNHPQPIAPERSNPPREDTGLSTAPVSKGQSAFLSLGVLADRGALPEAAPGIELSVGLRRRALELRAGLRTFAPSTALADGIERGATFGVSAGAVAVCGFPLSGLRALGVCGGLEVGWMRVNGYHLAVPKTPDTDIWVAPEGSLVARHALSTRWEAGMSAGVAVPVRRTTYTVATSEGERPLHRSAAVSGRAAISVACDF